MKTIDQHFIDWESHVFGYGYGTGEPHIIPALKKFFDAVPADGSYDYQVLEFVCGPVVAWLLLNTLQHAALFDYGTSPRFAWPTKEGRALRDYLASKTVEELLEALTYDEDYVLCYPDCCNCEEPCHNPFWRETPARSV